MAAVPRVTFDRTWDSQSDDGSAASFMSDGSPLPEAGGYAAAMTDIQTAADLRTKVTARALASLMKPSHFRTDEDVDSIIDVATGMPAFDRYELATRRELCAKMQYSKYEEGEFVFYEGDEPDGYYFILSGSVLGLKRTGGAAVSGDARYAALDNLSQINFVLKAGQAFGEGAMQTSAEGLLNPNFKANKATVGLRGASIKCGEPTELLVLSLDDYVGVLAKAMQRDLDMKVSYLAQLPLFLGWTARRVNDCAKCMTVESFAPNKAIVFEGGEGTALWIIWRGQVRVVRQLTFRQLRRDPMTGLSSSVERRVHLEIARLSEGELFGELSILSNSPCSASVVAISKVVVLKLPRTEFAKHITDKALQSITALAALYPSDETILARYAERTQWEAYKRRLVKEVMREKDARRVAASFKNPSLGFSLSRRPTDRPKWRNK
eukprot:c12110_g1_i1.p1 GENE.c12110_g1_i1~~c12110_g1_i1.p1  ORF type:complete len:437 (+),score=84.47 c12110_g1_i1:66-1376(+)